VIPFFDKYPLVVKKESYQKFRTIVQMMQQKEHFTREGFTRIVDLAFAMNQQRWTAGAPYTRHYRTKKLTPKEAYRIIIILSFH